MSWHDPVEMPRAQTGLRLPTLAKFLRLSRILALWVWAACCWLTTIARYATP
jgi:hypothetical protein